MDVDATPIIIAIPCSQASAGRGVTRPTRRRAHPLARAVWRCLAAELDATSAAWPPTQAAFVSRWPTRTYAIDLAGNVVWRVGARAAATGTPVVWNEL